MWSRRRSGRRELEAALRAHRTEPRDEYVRNLYEYVRSLSGRLHPAQTSPPRVWSKVAFAAGVSALILGMFASVGGVGYTASGATVAYRAVKQIVVQHKLAVSVHQSSASAQYPPRPHAAPASRTQSKGGPSAGVATVGTSKTLPFTGLSLVTSFAVGLVLLLVGLALRRRERRERRN